MKSEIEKLKILLEHWAEHNAEHSKNFRSWAEKARELNLSEVASDILSAANEMDKSSEYLKAALAKLKSL
ncbi:MAG: hypothetical protein QXQ02_02885 [Halobacteria archaeon]